MSDLSSFVYRLRQPKWRLPAFVARLLRAGVTSPDRDVVRRQIFTNVAAYAVALNAFSHLLMSIDHDFRGLMVLHFYNVAVMAVALSLHRLHRHGENLAAIGICSVIVFGHSFVVFALGYDSDLQVYFLLVGFLFFLFGVRDWKTFAAFYVAAFVMLVLTIKLGWPTGFLIPQDVEYRAFLQMQALANAMIIVGLSVAYVLVTLTRAEQALAREVAVSDALVDAMLPTSVSARLKAGEPGHIADHVDSATVLFADLAGFTPAAAAVTAGELVGYLDGLFSAFDALTRQHGVDKIKTIGDSYMAAGLAAGPQGNAIAAGRLALALVEYMRGCHKLGGVALPVRVGLHSGPVVAGVIGDLRVSYDIWGDTVNIASRMEAHGSPGRVQVSAAFRALAGDAFAYEERPPVTVKGLGETKTWFLLPKAT